VTLTNSAAPTSTISAAATYVVASSLAVTVTTDDGILEHLWRIGASAVSA